MTPTASLSALVAAPEGVFSSALRTFLETIPGVHVVARSASQAETLRELKVDDLDLLLLDCSLERNDERTVLSLQAFIAQIRAAAPELHIIALANDHRQKQLALNAGVPQAILKGDFDQALRQAVELISSLPDRRERTSIETISTSLCP